MVSHVLKKQLKNHKNSTFLNGVNQIKVLTADVIRWIIKNKCESSSKYCSIESYMSVPNIQAKNTSPEIPRIINEGIYEYI
jgi:uncharacterized protein YaaQ